MADKTYDVHRSMMGDKEYVRGDTRTMSEADAATLVESGALSLEGEDPVAREPAVIHAFGSAKSESAPIVKPPREPSVKAEKAVKNG